MKVTITTIFCNMCGEGEYADAPLEVWFLMPKDPSMRTFELDLHAECIQELVNELEAEPMGQQDTSDAELARLRDKYTSGTPAEQEDTTPVTADKVDHWGNPVHAKVGERRRWHCWNCGKGFPKKRGLVNHCNASHGTCSWASQDR